MAKRLSLTLGNLLGMTICLLLSQELTAMTATEARLFELLSDPQRETLELRAAEDKERFIGKKYCLFEPAFQHPSDDVAKPSAKIKAAGAAQGIDHLTVGSFADCDFPSIQLAVNAAASNQTIRVTNQTYSGDAALFNVINKNITIRGGYTNCSANGVVSGRTALSGLGMTFADSIIELSDSSGGMSVDLYDLFIVSGQDDANGGGGIEVSGSTGGIGQRMNVTLHNLIVAANDSNEGGGLHVTDANLVVTDTTLISNNTATDDGGGIYCAPGTLQLRQDTQIFGNQANNGGGIYLDTINRGASVSLLDDSLITLNRGAFGGGIFLQGSSENLANLVISDAMLTDNDASENGGAIDSDWGIYFYRKNANNRKFSRIVILCRGKRFKIYHSKLDCLWKHSSRVVWRR